MSQFPAWRVCRVFDKCYYHASVTENAHRIILDIRYIEYLELFDSNSHPLYGPFQLCFSIMFDKSKQAERSQNKMQYIPLHWWCMIKHVYSVMYVNRWARSNVIYWFLFHYSHHLVMVACTEMEIYPLCERCYLF